MAKKIYTLSPEEYELRIYRIMFLFLIVLLNMTPLLFEIRSGMDSVFPLGRNIITALMILAVVLSFVWHFFRKNIVVFYYIISFINSFYLFYMIGITNLDQDYIFKLIFSIIVMAIGFKHVWALVVYLVVNMTGIVLLSIFIQSSSIAPLYILSLALSATFVSGVFIALKNWYIKKNEEQKEFFALAADSLDYPFYIIDLTNYQLVFANKTAKEGGYRVGQKCHKCSHHFPNPCRGENDPCTIEQIIKTGNPVILEHTHFDNNCNPIPVEVRGFPIRDDTGRITQVIEYSIDISERKRAETDSQKLSRALEQSPASVVLTDTEGNIEYVNPKFTQVTGYTFEEAIGQNPRILKSGEWPPEAYQELWNTIKSGKEWHGEFHNKKKDGSNYWETASISPIFDHKGNITHFMAIKEDITERKMTQEQLTWAMEEVNQMNIKLEKRLIESIEELRKKDQTLIFQSRLAAMGEMLGYIAHQWKQPLNTLLLMVQNLDERFKMNRLDQEYINKSVEKFKRMILFMAETIDDFRNFFKPNSQISEFKAFEVIERMLSFVDAVYRLHSIEVEKQLDESLTIKGLPNELSQVILNILNNAKDAFVERMIQNPKVLVRLYQENGKVVITIGDNAGGIDPNTMSKLFKTYHTTKKEGTGLGLYMSKNIIEKMNGALSVKNSGDGVEFRIEF